MDPLVSIIIPTFNRANDLKRAINSVLCQTYSNWEILVVDNYSDDNTDEIISLFNDPRIKIYKIHNEGVIAASRNKGIQQSSGKYIAFLDSDDWWLPPKLEESVKYLEQGADVVYHDLFLASKNNQKFFWKKAKSRELTQPIFNDLILNGNALNNSSVVVAGDFIKKLNGFSENKELVAAEDYDGWLRLAMITNKFKKIKKTLGCYWVGGGNTSALSRTIKVTSIIEKLYNEKISQLSSCYFAYIKGRSYYLMGDYSEARKYFRIVSSNNKVTCACSLKIKIMSLIIFIKGG